MQAARQATRLQRELQLLQSDPPPGACVWPCEDNLTHLQAQIQGPDETVYAKGMFILEILIPQRYPFEPPSIRFKTPIYHPNIDNGGRICLDLLNMPPKGSWKPSLNISTLLISIRLLLSEPNPDDGLMTEITAEYKHNRSSFDLKARQWTEEYAVCKQESHKPGKECLVSKSEENNVERSEHKVQEGQWQAATVRPRKKLSVSKQPDPQCNLATTSTSQCNLGTKDGAEIEVPQSSTAISDAHATVVVSDSGSELEDDDDFSSRRYRSLAMKKHKGTMNR